MTIALRDGSRIAIRPIEPDDRDSLRAGFERLSPQSRYRRFFGPMPQLRERDLDYLTRVDHHDHEALVAVDEQTGEGVGVARFVRVAPDVAEPAMVVSDDWQGRGVASALLDALVRRARDEGIRTFHAPTLATNIDAIRVLERLGTTTRRRDGREVELRIELAEPSRGRPSLAPLLRHFASGAAEPARTLLDHLWPRRHGKAGDARRNVVVVGTDGSEHGDAAVHAAAELAAHNDAGVEVVGVHPFLLPEQPALATAVATAAAALRARGLHVHEHVRRGDPALVLTDVAVERNARLIVVGAGGRGATRRLIGGVADVVAERAPCDVLIVRPREDAPAYAGGHDGSR